MLSTNRHDDLVEKATAYATHGLRDHRGVDPRFRTVSTYTLSGGLYELTREHGGGVRTLTFGSTDVSLDLDDLLA